jgi:hypothetical protein
MRFKQAQRMRMLVSETGVRMSSWRYRRFASLAIRRLAISDSIGLDRAKCRMTSPLFAPMMNFQASGLSRRDPTKVAQQFIPGKIAGKRRKRVSVPEGPNESSPVRSAG